MKIIHQQKVDRILLEGHCDNIGSKAYNYTLSDNRANAVKKLLVENGILQKSVKKCIGFGKDRPLTLNETEIERQINRRVVITFYLMEEPKPRIKDSVVASKPIKKEFKKEAKPELKREYSKIATAEIGDNIILDNILFQPGRHYLKEESFDDLENLIQAMKLYPCLEIEIQGYVCCATTEPDGYDWDTETNNLSEMRAREIYYYLIKNNIERKRLRYKGFGGKFKINEDESTEELRRVNRRVEIKILKK
jgi:outer membrane protein OmpA-like peptidoglycan-associated protein